MAAADADDQTVNFAFVRVFVNKQKHDNCYESLTIRVDWDRNLPGHLNYIISGHHIRANKLALMGRAKQTGLVVLHSRHLPGGLDVLVNN